MFSLSAEMVEMLPSVVQWTLTFIRGSVVYVLVVLITIFGIWSSEITDRQFARALSILVHFFALSANEQRQMTKFKALQAK